MFGDMIRMTLTFGAIAERKRKNVMRVFKCRSLLSVV